MLLLNEVPTTGQRPIWGTNALGQWVSLEQPRSGTHLHGAAGVSGGGGPQPEGQKDGPPLVIPSGRGGLSH